MAAGRGRPRRAHLPGVAELFRSTTVPADATAPDIAATAPALVDTGFPDDGVRRAASGRERHTTKITVYLSTDELLDLEQARLLLRRIGITADRGRLVREAVAVLVADLAAHGETSVLARRIGRTASDDDYGRVDSAIPTRETDSAVPAQQDPLLE